MEKDDFLSPVMTEEFFSPGKVTVLCFEFVDVIELRR